MKTQSGSVTLYTIVINFIALCLLMYEEPDRFEVQPHTYNEKYTAPYISGDTSVSLDIKHPTHYPTGTDGPSNYTVLTKNDDPFIYCPAEIDIMSYKITVPYKNPTTGNVSNEVFIFDEEWNQYLWENYKKTNKYYNSVLIT